MKKCTLCNIEKPYSEFHKQRGRGDGYCSWCKPCKSEKKKAEYRANREKVLARVSAYRKANPEKVAEAKRRARLKKLEQYKARSRAHYRKNRERITKWQREYRRRNWPQVLATVTRYKRERLRRDPVFRAEYSMRCRIYQAFRKQGYGKQSSTRDLIGCDWPELMQHMEAQFQPGMTMDNYGEWHVDHIIPLATAKTEDELRRLCHYTNLQPLWAADNIRKGASLPEAA